MLPFLNFTKRYLKEYFEVHSNPETPLALIQFITNRCNAKCGHCFFWREMKQKKDELTLNEFRKIASSLKRPLLSLNLTGGEPFLRDDINKICEIFVDINKTKSILITTNGLLTKNIYSATKKIIENIDNSVNIQVQVSLDGLEKTHNKIRGINIFDNAVKTILELKKLKKKHNNFDVYALAVLSNVNYNEIEELAEFVQKKLKVKIIFEMIRGEPRNSSFLTPPKDKLDELQKTIRKIYSDQTHLEKINSIFSLVFPFSTLKYIMKTTKENKQFFNCLAGSHTGVIYNNGDIAICELIKPIGNLRKNNFDFSKIWNSKKADKMREKAKNCFCTHGCFLGPAVIYDFDKFFVSLIKYTKWKDLFR